MPNGAPGFAARSLRRLLKSVSRVGSI